MTGDETPAAELVRLRAELARHQRLAEASYALHTTLDLDLLLQLILATARDGVEADRGTVFLLSEDGTELWSKVLQGEKALEIRLPAGKGIAGSVASTGQTVRIADAYDDPRFDRSWDKKTGYRTRQILCAPIRSREGRVVGVFQLLNRTRGDFSHDDETFLEALSVHAAQAVENARLHHASLEKERQDREIALVQGVQRAFQPERVERTFGSLDVACLNVLCEDASGDYYDAFEIPGGRVAVAIGDVAGHGLQAAVVMTQARALLHAFSQSIPAPERLLDTLNDYLARDLTRGRFMTMFLATLDPSDGSVAWSSAGHLPGIVVRADGSVLLLESQGRVLGILSGAVYPLGEPLVLAPGETLLLYTDGATEARSPGGELFGDDRFIEVASRAAGETPVHTLEAVVAALLAFSGRDEMGDDLTLVAVRRRPS